ncbi:MAG: cytidine deaminase [Bacilli bacterium]|jgi:cytidine deaminase
MMEVLKDNFDFETMFNRALKALEKSYSPYSKLKVASIIKTKGNLFFEGVNIENASYGLTNCAERSALYNAYSKGVKKEEIEKMLVLSSSSKIISPCGACRQVMVELMNEDAEIIMCDANKNYRIVKVKELLPLEFNSKDLT